MLSRRCESMVRTFKSMLLLRKSMAP